MYIKESQKWDDIVDSFHCFSNRHEKFCTEINTDKSTKNQLDIVWFNLFLMCKKSEATNYRHFKAVDVIYITLSVLNNECSLGCLVYVGTSWLVGWFMLFNATL